MTKTLRYLILASLLLGLQSDLHAQEIVLRAGTLLHCTLNEPSFSSRTAELGEPLICYARQHVEFGRLAFPRGSYLTGRLVDYRDPGHFIGKGWLKLEFDRLILPDTEIPLLAKVVSVRGYRVDPEGRIIGRGHPKRDAFGWMLPPIWPIKFATLPMCGPRPTLRGEFPVTLRLLEDVEIPDPPNPRASLYQRGDSRNWQAKPATQKKAKRPLTDRLPILNDLRHSANPFMGPNDYRRRRVEKTFGEE